MIISKIFEIKSVKNLDKSKILDFFKSNNLKLVKWSVVDFYSDTVRVLAAIEK